MEFTTTSLPYAIDALFRANNYTVERSVKVAGGEVDIVARPNGDPFAPVVWVEATIEYVGNTKYGKDLTKLEVVGREDPGAVRLIVSSSGFTPDVRERAEAARIQTLTYTELFRKFERFEPYVRNVTGETELADDLRKLEAVYERPDFYDEHGEGDALDWLENWIADSDLPRWLVVTGEYGTGKTALSKVLQSRWTTAYKLDPTRPIPFRIELRDFTRQFDANGLLHHALDRSGLGHIPINFAWSAIRSGRIVLLLDGYDEMAQYLSSRERRVCLEALAELSAGGAKGLLFSRPNYFSEAEELHLLDTLYRDLEGRSQLSAALMREVAAREQALDSVLEQQFIARFERALRDLSPSQTESLVLRQLLDDPTGARVVTDILRRVFRSNEDGSTTSLSGKPVIISYILDIVDQLKEHSDESSTERLTEWEVYELVLDNLMVRDWRQAGVVSVAQRRAFLQQVAIVLSLKDMPFLEEESFLDLVSRLFRRELSRFGASQRRAELESLFQDLRRSATLTRNAREGGWRFSHNSLREFLLAEAMLDALAADAPFEQSVPVSDAMKQFVSSLSTEATIKRVQQLASRWANRHSDKSAGLYFQLFWEALIQARPGERARDLIALVAGPSLGMDNVSLARVSLTPAADDLSGCSFAGSELSSVDLSNARLRGVLFTDAILDGVDFSDADLREAKFDRCYIQDCSFIGTDVTDAEFSGVDDQDVAIIVRDAERDALHSLTGRAALGYLAFHGARTRPVDDYSRLRHHPLFPIVEKVLMKLAERSPRQRLGLVQKGASARNISFAKELLERLQSEGVVEVRGGRIDVLYLTSYGRTICADVLETSKMPQFVAGLLDDWRTTTR